MVKAKKVAKNVFIIFAFMFAMFFVPKSAFALGIVNGQTVDADKVWTINFSKTVQFDDSTKNAITVSKENGDFTNVSLKLGSDGKSIIVMPPSGGYQSGNTYILKINKAVHTPDNVNLNDQVLMNFNIKEEGTAVNNYNDFYEGLKCALQNFNTEVKFNINNYDKNTYDIGNAINKVLSDNPTIDYGYSECDYETITDPQKPYVEIDASIKYSKSKDEMTEMKNEAESTAEGIISKIIKPDMEDWQKELAIHDYVVNNTRYDEKNFEQGISAIPVEDYTDYGVLVKHSAVCEGYAKAMCRLLGDAGIECLYVTGKAEGGAHAWNIVKIGGNYYGLDTTFDDPVSDNGADVITHQYFNVTDSVMSKDHSWDTTAYPKCTSTQYSYRNLQLLKLLKTITINN